MKVYSVPVLETNYAYVVAVNGSALIIDPGESLPVLTCLIENQLSLEAILLTHKHQDHIRGVLDILDAYNVPVYGGDDVFPFGIKRINEECHLLGMAIKVLRLPGHTVGGVGYYINGCLFTGDVLFGGGCGLLFEGTSAEMTESLDKIAVLKEDTLLYFGHEYTRRNLSFAKYIEPDNKEIIMRLKALGECSTPSTLRLEKRTNPFLRLDESVIIEKVSRWAQKKIGSRVECFAHLRQWKTEFDKNGK